MSESANSFSMERLLNVEAQVTLLERGAGFISCPFCLKVTSQGETAECCERMENAIAAILHRKLISRQIAHAAQIAQNKVN